jgi:hypothetical protein
MSDWQILDTTHDDDEVINTILAVFTDLYTTHFADELLVNHELPIEIRAFRHTDLWRICLLLTPWTLARLFLPDRPPKMPLPIGWLAEERAKVPLTVIGPAMPLAILGGREMAHLNYLPQLGHYFIQPLIQSMEKFKTPDDAFNAWNEVIKTRNKVIEEQNRECAWQEDVSRREFFAKLRRRA